MAGIESGTPPKDWFGKPVGRGRLGRNTYLLKHYRKKRKTETGITVAIQATFMPWIGLNCRIQYGVEFIVLGIVAFGAALLTFISGFGLGTLLMPALACFVAPEAAVALTAVVHLLTNLTKVALVGKQAQRSILLQFGLPAIAGGLAGGYLLTTWSQANEPIIWQLGSWTCWTYPAPLAIGLIMLSVAVLELNPWFDTWRPQAKWLPLGGLVSGLLGGLSGHQGALRSAFLIGLPTLTPVSFVATGAVIACAVDGARLLAYGSAAWLPASNHIELLGIAAGAALAGTWAGNRWLPKVTLPFVRRMVGVALLVIALRLITGGFPLPA